MGLPNEIISGMLSTSSEQTYEILRSLRFNAADTAYLSRTPSSAGNRKTWTWSGWIKLINLSTTRYLFSAGTASTDYTAIYIDGTTNTLNCLRVISSATDAHKSTTRIFRDTAAWYHIVVAMDAANTSLKMYVNGEEITSFSTNDEPSNIDGAENNTVLHEIGRRSYTPTSTYFNGYLTEVHFIDGQALTASSFGQTDAETNNWNPKRYSGVYGTNGFYLSFSDNTSTTTLGYDDAGSNDWTLTNFSVSAGSNNDSLTDTPTDYGTDSGLGGEIGGNFAICSSIVPGTQAISLNNGNLTLTYSSANWGAAITNFAVNSGKWYYEILVAETDSGVGFGWTTILYVLSADNGATGSWIRSSGTIIAPTNRYKITYNSGLTTTEGMFFSDNSIVKCAVDFDEGKLWVGTGSTWFSGNPSLGTTPFDSWTPNSSYFSPWFLMYGSPTAPTMHVNFGQRPFSYTAPTGFKSLCSQNLPTPQIVNGSKFMNAVTWTGTGDTRSITGVGFQPDLIWSKSRSNAETHKLVDSVRGATKALSSETTGDEVTESGITSFDTDGFTINSATDTGYNTNTYTYVGWNWKKGTTPGFDIVTYTGNGSARTISHSLGAVPHFIIIKARTTASTDQNWVVYHRSNTNAPATDYLMLNSTAGTIDLNTVWNDTGPTTSVFSVGTSSLVNTNNDTYVAYLWTEINNFSRFTSYFGNVSSNGPFVYCGFRPKFIMIKSNGTGDWWIYDDARGTENPFINKLLLNSNAAEDITGEDIDILSNGFKIRTTASGINSSSIFYLVAAFAENPFKYSRAQ